MSAPIADIIRVFGEKACLDCVSIAHAERLTKTCEGGQFQRRSGKVEQSRVFSRTLRIGLSLNDRPKPAHVAHRRRHAGSLGVLRVARPKAVSLARNKDRPANR